MADSNFCQNIRAAYKDAPTPLVADALRSIYVQSACQVPLDADDAGASESGGGGHTDPDH